MIDGVVTKGVAGRFSVDTKDGIITCYARGKLKKEGEIRVGDYVGIDKERGAYVLAEVKPRRNALIRPYVANVDICFIVVAPVPQPDFLLVDKIIINARMNGIEPVLLVNKSDIQEKGFFEEIQKDYSKVLKVFGTGALTGDGIHNILEYADGKTVCFAGQSAVGKSSMMNAILGYDQQETGGLSKKTERGKHTTRQSEIIKVNNTRFIDTCGFSMFDLPDEFKYSDLVYYYDEFSEYALHCKFRTGCTHVNEPECAVKKAVEDGIISKNRYDRYCVLFNELKEKWRKRYE